MELIRSEIHSHSTGKKRVELATDRQTLAKRRWRGVAWDGREFGFDLTHPFSDGAAFFETDGSIYVVTQQQEPVIEIDPGKGADAARTGWMIGNLHFPIQIEHGLLRTPDDPAIRQLLDREAIPYSVVERVFHPLKAVAHHHHAH